MKSWSGRFTKKTDKIVEEFTSSLSIDKRLYQEDIEVNLAHAEMLKAAGILTPGEGEDIRSALKVIKDEIQEGGFQFDPADEDIHMAIERALIEKIGPAGGKLHTARSRNDQVATDTRLFLKRTIIQVGHGLLETLTILLEMAEKNKKAVVSGYTHLQRAQPIFFSHHLLAYVAMLQRDARRLIECYDEADVLPLGSAALAGTSLPIDRGMVAKELGFSRVSVNSMDAVSDRDFVLQFLSAAAILMTHLSRLTEDLIIWSSSEFAFIEMDDAFTTGSSIMPQKKNPDVAELIRGKSSRVIGNLTAMLTLMKSLPLTYNRDLQEDKGLLFDTTDTLFSCLTVLSGVLQSLEVDQERMAESANGFGTATDYADYLVQKGVPFRSAHEIVGKLVKSCLDQGKTLADLTLMDLQDYDARFETDALALADPASSAASRESEGGTGKASMDAQIKTGQDNVVSLENWLTARS